MSRGADVIVAGAGALGLSVALALADAGCRVTVCDPADEPRASAVAAGMLAPVFEAVLDAAAAGDLDLLLAARNLWPALAARTGTLLWKVNLGGEIVAGPITYQVDGKQYIAIAGGNGLFAFGLRE